MYVDKRQSFYIINLFKEHMVNIFKFQRKRKRRIPGAKVDPDSVSICSLDLDTAEQPETKKKKLPRYIMVFILDGNSEIRVQCARLEWNRYF